jgi:riboflavin kinase/FMN adenylyltransferase
VQYVFALPEHRQSAVLAVSSFDGVHSRHQRLLAEATAMAERLGVTPIALLPWPPSTDDSPGDGILTTLGERITLIERCAPAVHLVALAADAAQPWSPATLVERITTGWDVQDILIDPSSATELCGIDLANVARLRDVPVTALAHEEDASVPSASMGARIRAAIAEGRAAEAARLLTYDYTLSAEVVGGDRRGRLLGFPTANLRVDAGKLIPGNGIYAVRVALPGDRGAMRPAVASVGVRPTFGDGNARLVEVHLLDLSMDLYGVRIETAFVAWLRAEERFATVEALIRQMAADVAQARQCLAGARDDTEGQ